MSRDPQDVVPGHCAGCEAPVDDRDEDLDAGWLCQECERPRVSGSRANRRVHGVPGDDVTTTPDPAMTQGEG